MATLGLENGPKQSPQSLTAEAGARSRSSSCSSASSFNSSRHTPIASISRHPHKSQSVSSLRDFDPEGHGVSLRRVRYAPYSSPLMSARRGSLPSISLNERNTERQSKNSPGSREGSLEPSPSRATFRRNAGARRDRSVTRADSLSTPISSYVRRKTPQASPTTPNFPHNAQNSSDALFVPSIPTLPTLLPRSSSPALPMNSAMDVERPRSRPGSIRGSPLVSSNGLPEISESEPLAHHAYLHTGVRISGAPRSDVQEHYRRFVSPMA
ncbi:hypothetical protein PLICRDRAFT_170010 [Plicaturopsis crispa FD-325 SS-3]|nr:hypothetical protein PLICRDRAFT_170010 [Plicaturopsis crispa FD-325 SS-3]